MLFFLIRYPPILIFGLNIYFLPFNATANTNFTQDALWYLRFSLTGWVAGCAGGEHQWFYLWLPSDSEAGILGTSCMLQRCACLISRSPSNVCSLFGELVLILLDFVTSTEDFSR